MIYWRLYWGYFGGIYFCREKWISMEFWTSDSWKLRHRYCFKRFWEGYYVTKLFV